MSSSKPSAIKPTILVIIGISGDLSRRKLLPAIKEIAQAGALPSAFRIVGISRRPLQLGDIVPDDEEYWQQHIELHQMDLEDSGAYHELASQLQGVERSLGGKAQRLFYLSVPPEAVQQVVQLLGHAGLADVPDTKLLLEKPFGTDLASAQKLVTNMTKYFKEAQVYRIDHYLAKEMAQNLIVFRSSNPLFAHTWDKTFISSIEIIMTETIGVEGRATFYEQTGALRDVVQSHLLQLAALTLMELPDETDWAAIPKRRLRALESLKLAGDVKDHVQRGQYLTYRQEVKNASSKVETFVSLELASTDARWAGVPITLTTGKAMDSRCTEINLYYRSKNPAEANALSLRIQPDEGVEFCLWLKKPGFERKKEMRALSFGYKQSEADLLPEAYERVFVDAMRSDHSLFTTSEEVLATWKILQPVQKAWAESSDDLIKYENGKPPTGVAPQRDA